MTTTMTTTTTFTEARRLIDAAEQTASDAVRLLWQAGHVLTRLRDETPHGQWGDRLQAAGITSQRASEAIRLAHLGEHQLPTGVRAALAAVTTTRHQTPDASGITLEEWVEQVMRAVDAVEDLLTTLAAACDTTDDALTLLSAADVFASGAAAVCHPEGGLRRFTTTESMTRALQFLVAQMGEAAKIACGVTTPRPHQPCIEPA